jgi:gliding motility-associated-like protein
MGRDTIVVLAGMAPEVWLGNDLEKCSFDSVILKNYSDKDGFSYLWSTGETSKQISVKADRLYWLEVRTNCGIIRDSIFVTQKNTDCNRDVFVPNAFSPNKDSRNDFFSPIVKGSIELYQFYVYNRWGEIVFNSKNPNKSWDGNYRGKAQPGDIYVWQCQYQISGLPLTSLKGTVLLIR